MNRKGLLAALLVSGVLLLSGCGSAMAPAEPVVLNISDFAFNPSTITVKAGQPVTLQVKNAGSQLHDFTAQDMPAKDVMADGANAHHDMAGMNMSQMVHVAVDANKTASVTFTPTKAGTYTFICTVAGHADMGMKGMITVQ